MGDGWLKGPWFEDEEVKEMRDHMWFNATIASFLHVVAVSLGLKSAAGLEVLAMLGWLPGLLLLTIGWCAAFVFGIVAGSISWANSLFEVVKHQDFRISLILLCIAGFLVRQGLKASKTLDEYKTLQTLLCVSVILSLLGALRVLQFLKDFAGQYIFLYILMFFFYAAIAFPGESKGFDHDGFNREWRGKKRF